MNEAVVIGLRIPGIRYRQYFTDHAVFLLPCFPQTADEEDFTERFLKRNGYVLARWRSYVISFWVACITTTNYEIGETVIFAEEDVHEERHETGRRIGGGPVDARRRAGVPTTPTGAGRH